MGESLVGFGHLMGILALLGRRAVSAYLSDPRNCTRLPDAILFNEDYFAAGGVATPADAALMMELGAEGVFVGSGIFKSGDPAKRAAAIVQAVTNWQDAKLLAKLSENLGPAMVGINADEIETIMEERGK